MKKAFLFIESLKPIFYALMGFPTIKVHSDYTEVYFYCKNVVRTLKIFELDGYDEFCFYAVHNCITFVYTFYNNED